MCSPSSAEVGRSCVACRSRSRVEPIIGCASERCNCKPLAEAPGRRLGTRDASLAEAVRKKTEPCRSASSDPVDRHRGCDRCSATRRPAGISLSSWQPQRAEAHRSVARMRIRHTTQRGRRRASGIGIPPARGWRALGRKRKPDTYCRGATASPSDRAPGPHSAASPARTDPGWSAAAPADRSNPRRSSRFASRIELVDLCSRASRSPSTSITLTRTHFVAPPGPRGSEARRQDNCRRWGRAHHTRPVTTPTMARAQLHAAGTPTVNGRFALGSGHSSWHAMKLTSFTAAQAFDDEYRFSATRRQ